MNESTGKTSTPTDEEFERQRVAACLANDGEDLEDVLDHLAGLRRRITAFAAVFARRREPRGRAAWSFRATAVRLGVGRDRLRGLARAGAIRTIPWGMGWRVPAAELERLLAEGLPSPVPSPTPPPKGRRRDGRAAARGARQAAVEAILKHPVE